MLKRIIPFTTIMTLAIGIIVFYQWLFHNAGSARAEEDDIWRQRNFQDKRGRLTVAFAAILAAFALILTGLKMQGDRACLLGFILLVAAMLYSPFKV